MRDGDVAPSLLGVASLIATASEVSVPNSDFLTNSSAIGSVYRKSCFLHLFRERYRPSFAGIFEAHLKLLQNPAVQEEQIRLKWDTSVEKTSFKTV